MCLSVSCVCIQNLGIMNTQSRLHQLSFPSISTHSSESHCKSCRRVNPFYSYLKHIVETQYTSLMNSQSTPKFTDLFCILLQSPLSIMRNIALVTKHRFLNKALLDLSPLGGECTHIQMVQSTLFNCACYFFCNMKIAIVQTSFILVLARIQLYTKSDPCFTQLHIVCMNQQQLSLPTFCCTIAAVSFHISSHASTWYCYHSTTIPKYCSRHTSYSSVTIILTIGGDPEWFHNILNVQKVFCTVSRFYVWWGQFEQLLVCSFLPFLFCFIGGLSQQLLKQCEWLGLTQ